MWCSLSKSSEINQLDPFLNSDDIICFGGRIKRSILNEELKFPIILPKEERVATLIIQDCHSRCAHGGRGATLNELCSRGYWITKVNSAVRSVIFKCVLCRRLRGRIGVNWQKFQCTYYQIPQLSPTVESTCLDLSWSSSAEMKSNVVVQCLRAWEECSAYRNHSQFGHRLLYSSPKESHC